MFIILMHIFSNSLNTCLKCISWPKFTFGKISQILSSKVLSSKTKF